MIKRSLIALSTFMMIALGSTAWAGSVTGGNTTVNNTFTPSPSTVMNVAVAAEYFAIAAASTKTDTSNGIEYLMISTDGAIYQKTQATDGAVSAPPAAAASMSTSGYTTKGS